MSPISGSKTDRVEEQSATLAPRSSEEAEPEQLRQRIAELEAELERRRAVDRVATWLGARALKSLFGWNLAERLDEWWAAYDRSSPAFPRRESTRVLEAVINRFIRVGFWAVLFAVLPSALMFWQILLMRDQNHYLREQLSVMQNQDAATRRAQLIATIYDEDCSLPRITEPDGTEHCQMRASDRARREAVEAFITLARTTNSKKVDLSWARLRGLHFRNVDFRGISLEYADLRGVSFVDSDLRDVDLGGAILSGASIYGSDLSGAQMTGAYITETGSPTPRGTILRGARFADCRLSGVDMHDAQYDLTTQWIRVVYSSSTRWPEGFVLQSASEQASAPTNSFRLEESASDSRWSP